MLPDIRFLQSKFIRNLKNMCGVWRLSKTANAFMMYLRVLFFIFYYCDRHITYAVFMYTDLFLNYFFWIIYLTVIIFVSVNITDSYYSLNTFFYFFSYNIMYIRVFKKNFKIYWHLFSKIKIFRLCWLNCFFWRPIFKKVSYIVNFFKRKN